MFYKLTDELNFVPFIDSIFELSSSEDIDVVLLCPAKLEKAKLISKIVY